MSQTRLAAARRIVVKVGSALVTNNGTGLDLEAIGEWARQIAALREAGKEVVLVSSGAIACGLQALGLLLQLRPAGDLQTDVVLGAVVFLGHGRQLEWAMNQNTTPPVDRMNLG